MSKRLTKKQHRRHDVRHNKQTKAAWENFKARLVAHGGVSVKLDDPRLSLPESTRNWIGKLGNEPWMLSIWMDGGLRRIPKILWEDYLEYQRKRGEPRISKKRLLAKFLATEIVPKNPNGFTFDPITWSLPSFSQGVFVVSEHGYEKTFKGLPSEPEIFEWIRDKVYLFRRSGHYIGGYQREADKLYYVDVSIAVVGWQHMLATADQNRQMETFFPTKSAVIDVNAAKILQAA